MGQSAVSFGIGRGLVSLQNPILYPVRCGALLQVARGCRAQGQGREQERRAIAKIQE
jgi:hypothetical protein